MRMGELMELDWSCISICAPAWDTKSCEFEDCFHIRVGNKDHSEIWEQMHHL